MKTHLIRIGICSIVFLTTTSFYFQSVQYFVQFRIMAVPDSESAKEVDEKMSSKAGILDSRTDYITSTYFCLLSADADYAREDFENWFAKMGYSISCYSRGMQNVDMMISPHVLKNCVEENGEH
ncbi:MAG: hypothetical protein HYZ14_03765 [Bacteroidetes bacterium]|nr:hypothetical protein [Bacteroidota bacterium]